MEDFLSILAVAVFYLLIAVNGNKKKKARNANRKAPGTRSVAFDEAFAGQQGKTDSVHNGSSVKQGCSPREDDAEQTECRENRLHLHTVTQLQMQAAAEGEDPCHRGNAPEEEGIHASSVFSYEEEESKQGFTQEDVLRGMIMSEILKRPCKRVITKRNGRSVR